MQQIGYEPLAPVPSTTLLGSKVLMYPNVFKFSTFSSLINVDKWRMNHMCITDCNSLIFMKISKNCTFIVTSNILLILIFSFNVTDMARKALYYFMVMEVECRVCCNSGINNFPRCLIGLITHHYSSGSEHGILTFMWVFSKMEQSPIDGQGVL